jgi:hypothetical protein
MPVVAQFAQASLLIDRMGPVMISVQGSGRMEANIFAVAGLPQDAIVLSQLAQAGLMLRQYQVTESNPDMAQILGGVSIAPSGNQLNIWFTLTEDQLIALVKHNSFVMNALYGVAYGTKSVISPLLVVPNLYLARGVNPKLSVHFRSNSTARYMTRFLVSDTRSGT